MSIRQYLEKHGASVFNSDYPEAPIELYWSRTDESFEHIAAVPTNSEIGCVTIESAHVENAELEKLLSRVCNGLLELHLIDCGISSLGIGTLSLARNLKVLMVAGVHDVGSWEEALTGCRYLEEIYIRRSDMRGISNAFAFLKRLRVLTVEAARPVPNQSVMSLEGCDALESVTISSPGLVGNETLRTLPPAKSFQDLSIPHDQVSDTAIQSLQLRIPWLEIIELSEDDDEDPPMGG